NTGGPPAPTYTLSASPNSVTVAQGSSGTSTITVSPLNGFTGSVNLFTSSLRSEERRVGKQNPTTTARTLTLAASSSAAICTVTVTIPGASCTLTKPTPLSLTANAHAAPDYTLSASPSSVTVAQGSSGTSTITVSPLNGFTGSVNLFTSSL